MQKEGGKKTNKQKNQQTSPQNVTLPTLQNYSSKEHVWREGKEGEV